MDELLTLANDVDATASQVAIALVAAKSPFIIIGPRTIKRLANNLGALKVALTTEQLARVNKYRKLSRTR
jgi:aryl-alcohol dehydrogenase-like predicted oxidoreductase